MKSMFGNNPPLNTYGSGFTYDGDEIYPVPTAENTDFYVCGEDSNELNLLEVKVERLQ